MKNLEERIQSFGSPVKMLRSSPSGKYQFPVQPEFTNWIEEVRAWRESAAFMDQSYHMTSLYVRGKDALKLLSHVGVNSFKNFGPGKAKQLVCVGYDGYLIGDAILFGLENDEYNIVGRPVLANWIQFHAETGGYDVQVERDERSLDDPTSTRKIYRFEVQGPDAMKILEAVNEGGPLTTKFFQMGEITVAGCKAETLAHGMGGAAGLELWGPMSDAPKVKAALIEAGQQYGIREVGSKAYSVTHAESGWWPSPMPSIYAGEKMKPYREWLAARSFEGMSSLGGSAVYDNIEEYYSTPWDLDYGRHIKFDHDFIGREALEKLVDQPHRKKITLVLDKEDMLKAIGGMMEEGVAPKFIDWPTAYYAGFCQDLVLSNGKEVGVALPPAYSANERAWLALAVVDADVAEPGTELSIVWGEPDAENKSAKVKPNVERHRQETISATAHPWPIHAASRQNYRSQK